jgi:bifunctional DNase/RNase
MLNEVGQLGLSRVVIVGATATASQFANLHRLGIILPGCKPPVQEEKMIEVEIDSIRVSLMSEHRVIVLKALDQELYLPIWIGPYEAEAIAIRLKEVDISRPLTHDLLNNVIGEMGGDISHILVNDLRDDTFYAVIGVEVNGQLLEIDSRPSDAIALAVRAGARIFVSERVMEQASITPEEDIAEANGEEGDLSAFRDFVEGLDLDDLSS